VSAELVTHSIVLKIANVTYNPTTRAAASQFHSQDPYTTYTKWASLPRMRSTEAETMLPETKKDTRIPLLPRRQSRARRMTRQQTLWIKTRPGNKIIKGHKDKSIRKLERSHTRPASRICVRLTHNREGFRGLLHEKKVKEVINYLLNMHFYH